MGPKELMAAWAEAIPKIRKYVRDGKHWVVVTTSQLLAMRLMECHERVSKRNNDWAMTPETPDVDILIHEKITTKTDFPIIGWLFFEADMFDREAMREILIECGIPATAANFEKNVVACVPSMHVEAVGHVLAVCASEREGKISIGTPELN